MIFIRWHYLSCTFATFILLHTCNRLLPTDLSFSISADLLIHLLFYARIKYSFIAFSIDKACRYACTRVIRNSSRYALRFNIYPFLVNCRSNCLAHLVDFLKLGEHFPSDCSVLIFASTLAKYEKQLTRPW